MEGPAPVAFSVWEGRKSLKRGVSSFSTANMNNNALIFSGTETYSLTNAMLYR
jgi:hypothetical protein